MISRSVKIQEAVAKAKVTELVWRLAPHLRQPPEEQKCQLGSYWIRRKNQGQLVSHSIMCMGSGRNVEQPSCRDR